MKAHTPFSPTPHSWNSEACGSLTGPLTKAACTGPPRGQVPDRHVCTLRLWQGAVSIPNSFPKANMAPNTPSGQRWQPSPHPHPALSQSRHHRNPTQGSGQASPINTAAGPRFRSLPPRAKPKLALSRPHDSETARTDREQKHPATEADSNVPPLGKCLPGTTTHVFETHIPTANAPAIKSSETHTHRERADT